MNCDIYFPRRNAQSSIPVESVFAIRIIWNKEMGTFSCNHYFQRLSTISNNAKNSLFPCIRAHRHDIDHQFINSKSISPHSISNSVFSKCCNTTRSIFVSTNSPSLEHLTLGSKEGAFGQCYRAQSLQGNEWTYTTVSTKRQCVRSIPNCNNRRIFSNCNYCIRLVFYFIYWPRLEHLSFGRSKCAFRQTILAICVSIFHFSDTAVSIKVNCIPYSRQLCNRVMREVAR